MKEGRAVVVTAPLPVSVVSYLLDTTDNCALAQLVSSLCTGSLSSIQDARCARLVRLLLSPSFSAQQRARVARSGIRAALLRAIPRSPAASPLADHLFEITLRIFQLSSEDISAVQEFACASLLDTLLAWRSDVAADLRCRSAALIEQIGSIADRTPALLPILQAAPEWAPALHAARSSASSKSWVSCGLSQAERERLKALGPQKMIAD